MLILHADMDITKNEVKRFKPYKGALATVHQRFFAYLIDGIFLLPVSVGLLFVNLSVWQSTIVFFLANLILIVYKPFMEFKYKATLGKMVLGLRVGDYEGKQLTLVSAFLRNIFFIGLSVYSTIIHFRLLTTPGKDNISLFNFIEQVNTSPESEILNYILLGLFFVEGVVVLADQRRRSPHDMIGKSLVMEN
jgi:uncharacterized RDD family membrane protein YckC